MDWLVYGHSVERLPEVWIYGPSEKKQVYGYEIHREEGVFERT